MRLVLYSIILFLAGCGTTSKKLYQKLAQKDSNECSSDALLLSHFPAETLTLNKPVEGSLDDHHCLTLRDGRRTSYELYEFVPKAKTQVVDVLTFIKIRGFDLNGENTIAVPMVGLFKGQKLLLSDVTTSGPQWVHSFVYGDHLKTSFTLTQLVPNGEYRLLVTTNNRFLGREIPGCDIAPVIGPFGKTEVTLK